MHGPKYCRRASRFTAPSLAVVAVLLCASAAGAPASPAYPNPTPHLDVAYRPCVPPARLLGFDLEADGKPVTKPLPNFRVGLPTRVTLYWVPDAADWQDRELVVQFKGTGPLVEERFPIEGVDGAIGTVQTQQIDLAVPRFTHAGAGVLTFALPCADGEGLTVVYRGPSMTNPIVTTATFDRGRLEKALGPAIYPLRASFRLAPGARVPVRVPADAKPAIGIAVVSALSHDLEFQQGAPIMSITALGADGQPQGEVLVRAGIETSLIEYDVPRPGTFQLDQAEVIQSKPHPGDRLTWDMRPLQLHTYLGRLAFPKLVEPARLEVRYEGDKGVIDVYDLVLLYDPSALRPAESQP